MTRRSAGLAGLIGLAALAGAASAGDETPKPRSPVERMETARLKAAHEDVAKLRRSRREVASRPGWNDYRVILHAHAEDSAHTGGTRPEMLADAKQAGVRAIFLSDHHRPPKDFITDSWRGFHDGVLFIPGSEARGFLIHPMHSTMGRMDDPTPAFIKAVGNDGGLIFLSHIEERPDHPMTGLDGMEIYNRHADAKKDKGGILALVLKLTDPKSLHELEASLRLYPDELFAAQLTYPEDYLAKWDRETLTRRLTGVAANDCHHNQVLIVKMIDEESVRVGTNVDADDQMRTVSARLRPGIRALTAGRKPGDVVARIDLDPYRRSFLNVSTHVLAPALTEEALRAALRAGHAYVSHDWMGDPTGFQFTMTVHGLETTVPMGAEVTFVAGATFEVESPLPCHIRLLKAGLTVAEGRGPHWESRVSGPGVYRAEAWLVVDGEERPWVYSNPIYVR